MNETAPTTATLKVEVKDHTRRLDGHDERFERDEDWIRKIQNRPPIWVGFMITALTGLLCAGAAAIVTRMLGP